MKTYKGSGEPELTATQILDAFEEFGWDCPRVAWPDVVRRFGPAFGLTDKNGKPKYRAAALLLPRCKSAFNCGARDNRKYATAITAKARAYAAKHS